MITMKKSNRSPEEIAAEIASLREIKTKIRRTSKFGDDNHKAIQAQIETLEGLHSEDEIDSRRYDRAEYDAYSDYAWQSAMDARSWLDGDGVRPSDDWIPLM